MEIFVLKVATKSGETGRNVVISENMTVAELSDCLSAAFYPSNGIAAIGAPR